MTDFLDPDDEYPVGSIFDLLCEGKKIEIIFDTPARFYQFRSRIFAHKAEVEPDMISLDILSGEMMLKTSPPANKPNPEGKYIFELVEKKTTYKIRIIENE